MYKYRHKSIFVNTYTLIRPYISTYTHIHNIYA